MALPPPSLLMMNGLGMGQQIEGKRAAGAAVHYMHGICRWQDVGLRTCRGADVQGRHVYIAWCAYTPCRAGWSTVGHLACQCLAYLLSAGSLSSNRLSHLKPTVISFTSLCLLDMEGQPLEGMHVQQTREVVLILSGTV